MIEVLKLVFSFIADLFKPRAALEAEVVLLRQQLNVLRRSAPRRLNLTNLDRLVFLWAYRIAPSLLKVVLVVQPETLIRWHRKGFRAYWHRKSARKAGRPRIEKETRQLIRRMACENPLWGAPRIHGELLMLGINVSQASVSRYMPKRLGPPSQGWKTFLSNHADGIAALDLFVVPTISFKLLYGLIIVGHRRRTIVSTAATHHPTAEWLARQLTEAFPWDTAPHYLVRDRDGAFGGVFKERVRAMGIRDRPVAPRSPWQNAYAERLIGSVRRECTDHMIVLGERHLHRILKRYADYYNSARTHLSLNKDAPLHRSVKRKGEITSLSYLGGLHHEYVRI